MKRYVLTKRTEDIQLGHLYEHIFLIAFSNQLREDGYLSYLDYEISGEVLSTGTIVLRIDIFSSRLASQIEDKITDMASIISLSNVRLAIKQISAEKQACIETDCEKIIEPLEELHRRNWRNLVTEKIGEFSAPTSTKYLKMKDAQSSTRSLQVQFVFDIIDEHTEKIAPLFMVIGRIFANNISEMGENIRGLFNSDTWVDRVDGVMMDIVEFRQSGIEEQIDGVKDVAEQIRNDVRQPENIAKIRDFLQNGIYTQDGKWPFSPFQVVEECGKLLGGQNWRELATDDNILEVVEGVRVYCFYDGD